jgi:sulfur carrier protein
MKIKINGEDVEVAETELTISKLLLLREVKMPEMVSVEYNGEMLERSLFDTTLLKEGDDIEFLYFMGGGK